jgi:hypothetical protein
MSMVSGCCIWPGTRLKTEEEIMTDFKRFQEMLIEAKQSFHVEYCLGEVVPVWSINLGGAACNKNATCSFTFTLDGKLIDTAVI